MRSHLASSKRSSKRLVLTQAPPPPATGATSALGALNWKKASRQESGLWLKVRTCGGLLQMDALPLCAPVGLEVFHAVCLMWYATDNDNKMMVTTCSLHLYFSHLELFLSPWSYFLQSPGDDAGVSLFLLQGCSGRPAPAEEGKRAGGGPLACGEFAVFQ